MMEHEASIPWRELIIPQLVNFTVFIGLLVYYLKQPLQAHFSGKSEQFEVERRKAEESKVHAERQNFEVRQQLKVLEDAAAKNLEEAQRESEQLKTKMVSDAKSSAEKTATEAARMAEFELLRALATLRVELVNNSTQMAEGDLKKSTGTAGQSALNEEFITKIQAAKI